MSDDRSHNRDEAGEKPAANGSSPGGRRTKDDAQEASIPAAALKEKVEKEDDDGESSGEERPDIRDRERVRRYRDEPDDDIKEKDKDPKSVMHQMTHFPFNPKCEVCVRANKRRKTHRRKNKSDNKKDNWCPHMSEIAHDSPDSEGSCVLGQ